MGGKKQIIIIALLTLLVGGGIIGFSSSRVSARANQFDESGYILTSDEEEKQVRFVEGTTWRNGLTDTVTFTDVQGDEKAVSAQSFAHYQSDSLSALASGVVVDLNDVATAQVTNHYAISPAVVFSRSGGAYTPANTAAELSLSEFIWKLSEDKYMLVSPAMSVHFTDEDIREVTDFLEVTYIDEGVIQLQTQDNLWQTISEDCYAVLENGEIVNLSLRNISNSEGEVLMDFAKIVVNADDNVEIIPVTDEISVVKESVIPYFDITAEPGKDGEAGETGETGETGESGTQGEVGEDGEIGESGASGNPGSAGGSGTAGASGTNGAAGAPGSPGSAGALGSGTEVDGNLLHFPTFTLSVWDVSPTGCSGTITVTDPGKMLLAENGTVRLLDGTTNTVVADYPSGLPFYTTGNSFTFSFNGLAPDHSYRLLVSARINTGAENAVDYTRDFISKTFWTDSVGVYMEAGAAATTSADVYVGKQNYAGSTLNNPVVYLFSSYSQAKNATLETLTNPQNYFAQQGAALPGTVTFDGLSRNTNYYARLKISSGSTDMLTEQVLTLLTLKQTPSLAAPSLTANRDSWGFDLVPGVVTDPDNSITRYEYVFYQGGQEVRRVSAASSKSLVVPLGGGLEPGMEYTVQTIAYYDNNAVSATVVSPMSNVAKVTGGKLPWVYFTNTAGNGQGTGSSDAASESDHYDALEGVIHVAPGTEGAQLVLNAGENYVPTVTVRASGYYYVQFPVYLETQVPSTAQKGKYLTAVQDADGTVRITLNTEETTGTVNGLKPGVQYSIIVSGNLQNGENAEVEPSRVVGNTIVSTPGTVPFAVDWKDRSQEADANSVFVMDVSLDAPGGGSASTEAEVEASFQRQLETLSHLTMELRSGSASNPGNTLAVLELTDQNYAEKLGLTDTEKKETLGKQLESGITLTKNSFGSGLNLDGYASVFISITDASDYTIYPEYRVNQSAYAAQPDDPTDPGDTGTNVRYINRFAASPAAVDITLKPQADPLPGANNGFSSIQRDDENGDGAYESVTMVPNYANTGSLARTITFYAFDAPDFYDVTYTDEGVYGLSEDYKKAQQSIPLTPVTAVKKGGGPGTWLGKVTIAIGVDGRMPAVKFIPMTAEQYYQSLGLTEDALASAVEKANAGTAMDEKGTAYLFFYNEAHKDEPMTGHQFVFAWTLTYQGDSEVKYYPFDQDSYITNGIPRSPAQDCPHRIPEVYAVPWNKAAADADTYEWKMLVIDPDGAVTDKDTLYWQKTFNTARAETAATLTDDVITDQTDTAFTAMPAVTLGDMLPGSNPAALQVQMYTNKYNRDQNKGLHEGGNSYRSGSSWWAAKTQWGYYTNAFTFFNEEGEETPKTDNFDVQWKYYSGGTPVEKPDNATRLRFTVTGPQASLKASNGLRLTFSDTGNKTVTVDKTVTRSDGNLSVTANEDGTLTITFDVSISNELAALANQSVTMQMSLLYESGAEGYGLTTSEQQPVSLRLYTTRGDQNTGTVSEPANGWLRFDAGGVLESSKEIVSGDTALPRWGSFFQLENVQPFRKTDGTSGLGLKVVSTRNNKPHTLEETATWGISSGAGAIWSGSFSAVPRQLEVTGTVGTAKIRLPAVIPVIEYSKPETGSNYIGTEYRVVGQAPNTAYFLLQKETRRGYGTWETQVWKDSAWTSYSGNGIESDLSVVRDSTILKQGEGSTQDQIAKIGFESLEPDASYRIIAYYKVNENEYRRMMFINESPNVLAIETVSRPAVKLEVLYSAPSYSGKAISVKTEVSKASNYYYTVELRDNTGNFLTYLYTSTQSDQERRKFQVAEIGEHALKKLDQIHFDEDAKEPVLGSSAADPEKIRLNYGEEYQVVTYIYTMGEGPAFGEGTTSALIPEGTGKAFTVHDAADTITSSTAYDISTGSPLIRFHLSGQSKSARLREDSFAVAVVRTRNGQTADVTEQLMGTDGIDFSADIVPNYTSPHTLVLTQDTSGDRIRAGDRFTCYVYAILDKTDGTTEPHSLTGTPRAEILAGRGESDVLPYDQEVVEGSDGNSVLMTKATVDVKALNTYTGTISATLGEDQKSFVITLTNPVALNNIRTANWSIDAASGDKLVGTASGEGMPITFTQVSTNAYQFRIEPTFELEGDTVVDHVDSYTLTIEFFDEKGDTVQMDQSQEGVGFNNRYSTNITLSKSEMQSILLMIDPSKLEEMQQPELETPPVEETVPGEETTPPVEETTPPAEESAPPIEESTPPVEESVPPVEEPTPPVAESVPPIEEPTPPVAESVPPVEESTPPVAESTPPVEGTEPDEESESGTSGPGSGTGGAGTESPDNQVE